MNAYDPFARPIFTIEIYEMRYEGEALSEESKEDLCQRLKDKVSEAIDDHGNATAFGMTDANGKVR